MKYPKQELIISKAQTDRETDGQIFFSFCTRRVEYMTLAATWHDVTGPRA